MRRSSEQSRKRGKEFFFFIQIGDEVVNHLHSSKTPCRFNVCFRPWQSREDSHFICVLTNLGTYQLGSPVKFFRRALYEMHRIRWYFLVIFRGGRGVAVCVWERNKLLDAKRVCAAGAMHVEKPNLFGRFCALYTARPWEKRVIANEVRLFSRPGTTPQGRGFFFGGGGIHHNTDGRGGYGSAGLVNDLFYFFPFHSCLSLCSWRNM